MRITFFVNFNCICNKSGLEVTVSNTASKKTYLYTMYIYTLIYAYTYKYTDKYIYTQTYTCAHIRAHTPHI